MKAKWDGLNLDEVYKAWAEPMQTFSLGSINHGIEVSILNEHPPSLGKFMENCKGYKPPIIEQQLPHLHVVDKEKGLARIAEIKEKLTKKLTA